MNRSLITLRDSSKPTRNLCSHVFAAHKYGWSFVLFGSAFIISILVGQDAHAFSRRPCGYFWSCGHEIAQQPSSPASPQARSNPAPSPPKVNPDERNKLSSNIAEQSRYVTKLRQTNHAWNIAFVAIGVSMTLLATALGAVGSASDKAKARTTITIAVIGAVSAAAQTIASKIPVAKRAGEYAKIQAALISLEYKVKGATTQEDLKSAQNEFEKQISKIGEAEAAD